MLKLKAGIARWIMKTKTRKWFWMRNLNINRQKPFFQDTRIYTLAMGAGSSSGAVAIAFRLGYAIYDYGKRQYSILSIFWRRCACTRFNLRGLYSSFSIEARVFVRLITLHAWFSVWIACFLRSCHVCAVISISTLTSYVVIDRRPKLAFSFLVLCEALFTFSVSLLLVFFISIAKMHLIPPACMECMFSLCFFVSRISQKSLNRFSQNSVEKKP